MRVLGNHVIGTRLVQAAQIQLNLKRPEVHPAQFDRFGRDAERVAAGVQFDAGEIGFQSRQVVGNLLHRCSRGGSCWLQCGDRILGLHADRSQDVQHPGFQLRLGCQPAFAGRVPLLPRQSIEVVQTDGGHIHPSPSVGKRLMDPLRMANAIAETPASSPVRPGGNNSSSLLVAHASAPSILVGVIETRSPSSNTWSRATGWRLTRIK